MLTSLWMDNFNKMEESTSHMRRKKTRRGKKKSFNDQLKNGADWAVCGCGTDVEMCSTDLISNCEHMAYKSVNTISKRKKNQRLIRPCNSPRAPHNSTQFLIEDRLINENISLAISCDKENNGQMRPECESNVESFYINDSFAPLVSISDQCLSPDGQTTNWKPTPAYSDVDYEYKSFPDVDMLTFLADDFEQAFNNEKESELESKSKTELFSGIRGFAVTIETLQKELNIGLDEQLKRKSTENTTKDLQNELKLLIEDNSRLVKENHMLRQ